MKVIAINGSPHADGNTAIMLKKVLAEIEKEGIETELIHIGKSNIHGCRGCFACATAQNKKCAFNDDIFNELFAKVLQADALILGTPTYFSDMTPEMKSFIDRAGLVAVVNGNLLRRKVGAGVAVHRRGGAVSVQASLNHMFLTNEMIIPGSTYWNFGVGRNKGEVESDQEGLQNMANLGGQIAWLLKKICA